jgi:hypothetical protein
MVSEQFPLVVDQRIRSHKMVGSRLWASVYNGKATHHRGLSQQDYLLVFGSLVFGIEPINKAENVNIRIGNMLIFKK